MVKPMPRLPALVYCSSLAIAGSLFSPLGATVAIAAPAHPSSASLVAAPTILAVAQTKADDASSTTEDGAEAPPISLEQVSVANQFTLQLPPDWTMTAATNDQPITITNYPQDQASDAPQPGDLQTQIYILPMPPDQVIPNVLAEFKARNYSVTNFRPLPIDGATALRLFVVDTPETFPNAMYTYIGYGNETAVIVSRYVEIPPATVGLLEAVHGSFSRLTATLEQPPAAPEASGNDNSATPDETANEGADPVVPSGTASDLTE